MIRGVTDTIRKGPQVIDNSSATVMLGLEGMAVLAVSDGNGELEYAVETTQRSGWCPVCGAQARLHDRRPTWVRDLPAGGRSVTLVWVKRIWRCVHPECEQQTWTETHPGIAPRSSWTERARKQACRWVGRDGHSVAAVARDLGLGWATVMAAVVDHGSELIEREDRINDVHAMGVDETAFLRASPTRSTLFATGIVDLRRGQLIDIIDGRSRKVLTDWLSEQPCGWIEQIEVAALDPFRGYGSALSAGLPNAARVLDAFHVVRLGLAAIDDVRRRVQQQTYGHRGRSGDPLYGIRRVLRRGAEHLTDNGWTRLLAGIEAGDDRGQVATAWVAAQELRAIYTCRDRTQAATRLYDWTVMCIDSQIPELRRLARTLITWRTEFLAYFTTGRISNGPTEAVNLLIKKILRVGHGFRNFHNYRLRLLLHCGIKWQHHTPTPLRGRLPRLAA
jgi:transposase